MEAVLSQMSRLSQQSKQNNPVTNNEGFFSLFSLMTVC